MAKIYVITASDDDFYDVIRCFTKKVNADKFKERCNSYENTRPRWRVTSNPKDQEEASKKLDLWLSNHPNGGVATGEAYNVDESELY